MNSKQREHLETLRQLHLQRLRPLEIREATYGLRTEPEVLIEIESIKQKVADIDAQLSEVVKEIATRSLYLDVVIDHVQNVKESSLLAIHTLNPSRQNEKIRILQELLSNTRKAGKDIRILAPAGRERAEAIYELNTVRQIPIKVLTYLDDEDLRFTILDHDRTIISVKEPMYDNQGSVGVIIKSERLNMVLRNYFNDLWNREEAMSCDEFLRKEIQQLLDPTIPLSNASIAQKLGIPEIEVERLYSFE